jgi:uncharacterized membrane protein YbhN (UPF0104 family)
VLAGALTLLALQLRSVDFGSLFTGLNAGWTAAAGCAVVISLGAAAHNITAFAPLRLRARDTIRAQLAVGGLRIFAPSAVSTPAIGTRFLSKLGLPVPTAITVLAVAQTAQLLMTIVVVSTMAAFASGHLPAVGDNAPLIGAVVAGLVVVAVITARLFPAARKLARHLSTALREIGRHLRANPLRVLSGLAAAALLTAAHIGAFVCCVHAVGGSASLLVLAAVYLGASGVGSLIPTPGGIGAVESAMISGLVAAGLSAQTATGAALLCRLVTVWIPALPGLWALRSLRRDGLV